MFVEFDMQGKVNGEYHEGTSSGKAPNNLLILTRRLKVIPWDTWARERSIGMNCVVPRFIS